MQQCSLQKRRKSHLLFRTAEAGDLRPGKRSISDVVSGVEPETGYGFSGLFVFVSAEASRAVGTATTPSPVTATKKVNIFPPVVMG